MAWGREAFVALWTGPHPPSRAGSLGCWWWRQLRAIRAALPPLRTALPLIWWVGYGVLWMFPVWEQAIWLSISLVSRMSRRLSSLPFKSGDVSQAPTLWLKSSSLKAVSFLGRRAEWMPRHFHEPCLGRRYTEDLKVCDSLFPLEAVRFFKPLISSPRKGLLHWLLESFAWGYLSRYPEDTLDPFYFTQDQSLCSWSSPSHCIPRKMSPPPASLPGISLPDPEAIRYFSLCEPGCQREWLTIGPSNC